MVKFGYEYSAKRNEEVQSYDKEHFSVTQIAREVRTELIVLNYESLLNDKAYQKARRLHLFTPLELFNNP